MHAFLPVYDRGRAWLRCTAQGVSRFDRALHLEVSQVSAQARRAIEQHGGSVKTVYYNKLGLRALLTPEWFAKKERLLPKPARPPPKKACRFDAVGTLAVASGLPEQQQQSL